MHWRRVLAASVLLSCLVAGGGAWAYFQILGQPLRLAQGERTYLLEPGTGASRFALDLVNASLIDRPRVSRWVVRLYLHGQVIQAGEYQLQPGMSLRALLDAVRTGDVIAYSITFPEGWNIHQFRDHIAADARLQHVTGTWDNARLMAELGQPGQHPEGRFFPDTYAYQRGERDLDLLQRAHARMTTVLAEEWAQREEGLPYESEKDALIMASIVEKETGVASERAAIAGVFVRRLQRGMRLQTDPTVIYGLGANWDGNLTRAHLRRPTPYNTYVIRGLPPTPIAMPGRDAIHAALHPAPGEALYFVARGDGSHHFSATLAEHEAAVKKYQIRNRVKNYRSAPPGRAQ